MYFYVCIKNDYVFVNVNSPGISQFYTYTTIFYYCQQLMLLVWVTQSGYLCKLLCHRTGFLFEQVHPILNFWSEMPD